MTYGNLQSLLSSNGTLFFSAHCKIIKSLFKALRSKYLAGFCFRSVGRMIAKKLDFTRWREALKTSISFLAFAHFCSSSFSSRCKVRISFSNSGCLSFSLQKFTSWQGTSLHFALLCPDVWHIAHTLPRHSWTFGKSSSTFCFPCKWLLALCTCTSSSLRFSDSSIALRSKGLWKVCGIGLTGAMGPLWSYLAQPLIYVFLPVIAW